jgi:tRNA (mo5U34)-methyltransferase
MTPAELRRYRRDNPARALLESRGWYHSFRLPDGIEIKGLIPVEWLEYRWYQFHFPADLTGKRVLDIGTWDGWFSFEAERRGATVTAIDTIEQPTFREVANKLQSRVDYRIVDLFEVREAGLGTFDYVLFLGVLYHTKHPLLALEIVCGLTEDVAIVESFVTDWKDWERNRDAIPTLEFYETDELGGQLDNWFGPSVECLIGLCRAAGFARVEVLNVEDKRAALACHRHWAVELEDSRTVILEKVTNGIRRGINFRSKRDEYLTWYFQCSAAELTRDDLRLSVGTFGVPALQLIAQGAQQWLATSRLPPGLEPGWHETRLRIRGGSESEPRRIAVDLEPETDAIGIRILCDGRTWERNVVRLGTRPAVLSLWAAGLPENADEANTVVTIGGASARVTYVGGTEANGTRQVNADVPDQVNSGPSAVRVECGGVVSDPEELQATD